MDEVTLDTLVCIRDLVPTVLTPKKVFSFTTVWNYTLTIGAKGDKCEVPRERYYVPVGGFGRVCENMFVTVSFGF